MSHESTLANAASHDIVLRPMQAADLEAAHALSLSVHWPHRLVDWQFALRLGSGLVAQCDGELVGTALGWRWGPDHATLGLVIVDPRHQGQRIGQRLISRLVDDLAGRTILLHATAAARRLYGHFGFVETGELRQHQGHAPPAPLVALTEGWRLRPLGRTDQPALVALDAQARGMPRATLIGELIDSADSVVLDHQGEARGFALLRRFGRGLAIGPVVAPDADGAKALIAHLVGANAGKFVRIDVDADSGLGDWLESIGLPRVDAPTIMVRGRAPAPHGGPRLFGLVSQALG